MMSCQDTGMLNGDKDLLRISLVGPGHILITLESHVIF